MKTIPVNRSAQGLRVGIVVARFNHPISARLLRGATETLEERGADPDQIHVAWVPGAFEIPLAARKLAESKRYDALITLGSVIRGGTPHFDYVCIGVTDGVREVMRDTGCPVAFGVLTTDNIDQALSRAGGDRGNNGSDAALAAIELANLLRSVEAEALDTGSGG